MTTNGNALERIAKLEEENRKLRHTNRVLKLKNTELIKQKKRRR